LSIPPAATVESDATAKALADIAISCQSLHLHVIIRAPAGVLLRGCHAPRFFLWDARVRGNDVPILLHCYHYTTLHNSPPPLPTTIMHTATDTVVPFVPCPSTKSTFPPRHPRYQRFREGHFLICTDVLQCRRCPRAHRFECSPLQQARLLHL
jgi:hypothetical protein